MADTVRDLAQRLGQQAEAVYRHYLSSGRREGRYWLVGDVRNTPGRSMFVRLKETAKGTAGKWTDAATAQGAKLIGQYDSSVAFGQSRILLVWTRVIMPDGASIVLERQPGADTEGYAGLEDEVDNHWGMLFKAALLSTLLSVGAEAGTSQDENNLVQAIRSGASNSISQTSSQIVQRQLNIQPTLTVRPGFPVRVIVTRDLVLAPYGKVGTP